MMISRHVEMKVFFLGTKVAVTGREDAPPRLGVVQGACFVDGLLLYIVGLDEGFYSPGEDTYISKLVAHSDNLEEVE